MADLVYKILSPCHNAKKKTRKNVELLLLNNLQHNNIIKGLESQFITYHCNGLFLSGLYGHLDTYFLSLKYLETLACISLRMIFQITIKIS